MSTVTPKTGVVKSGTTRNDLLNGTDGDDRLSGGGGDDQIFGGAGDDRLGGDAGDDMLNGGSGSDRVDGGAGNDVLLYVASENRGARDDYDGGTGIDILQLVLTRDEWLQAGVQNDVARYLTFLNAHRNANGEATGQRFTFGAFGLDATKFEKLELKVNGVLLDARDETVDARDDAARVGEDARITGNVVTGTS